MEYKNVTFKDVPTEVRSVFTLYFNKDIISIGSLIRKLPYLLISLCEISSKEWIVSVEYNPKSNSFESSIGSNESSITIINPEQNSKSLHTGFNILNNVFKKDKWIPQEVTYGKVRFKTDAGPFTYEKTKWVSGDRPRYQFKVRKEALGGVIDAVLRWFKPQSTSITSSEVLETSISPNVY